MRILIVDDEYMNRYMLEKLLNKYGKCDMGVNGIEAIEAFKIALDEGNPYNLICMDLVMPGLDGHEALKLIREHEESFGIFGSDRVKVIIISSMDDFVNIKNAFTEFCEEYFVKPFDGEKIKETLIRLNLIE